eukprot:TRINITY_DN29970_c0_g2_i1.p2 TRINITY_DN29970_c0_g2~~TRINITY_DN29970_c0_g2_i1.p2  ORF type:complete len:270 (+),score=80.96 TRINITY_DN29970_c0_g2_i1:63-872(+)
MAVGKNKRMSKGGKRSAKRKVQDALLSKEWHDVVAPATYKTRQCTKTVVNKSKGTFSSVEGLKGRVYEVSLADLMGGDEATYGYMKVKLRIEDVIGRNALSNFHGMSLTTDKLRSLLKKWCSVIEAVTEVKSSDGYTMRLFTICITGRQANQSLKTNCHSQTSHAKKIRTKINQIITSHVSKSSLQKVVQDLNQNVYATEIKQKTKSIFALRECFVRKVKVTKTPKFDYERLLDIHGGENAIPKSNEGSTTKMASEEPTPAETTAEADD